MLAVSLCRNLQNSRDYRALEMYKHFHHTVQIRLLSSIPYSEILNSVKLNAFVDNTVCVVQIMISDFEVIESIQVTSIFTYARLMFSGVYWNQTVCRSVCRSICVSVCVQYTSFCQSVGGGIKSHLVTSLVFLFGTMYKRQIPSFKQHFIPFQANAFEVDEARLNSLSDEA